MRRADRLFHIVQLLRRHRLTTAARLAERLEVSERTVYRDIRDLQASGIPVEGEAGVGYRLGKNFELPPLMFTVDEVRALMLGARMVETWADDELRQAARQAIDKVHVALPPPLRKSMDDTALFALSFRSSREVRERMGVIRRAVDGHGVSSSTTATATASRPRGECGRSGSISGGPRGPSEPGASCARTTGAFDWTACSAPTPPARHLRTRHRVRARTT